MKRALALSALVLAAAAVVLAFSFMREDTNIAARPGVLDQAFVVLTEKGFEPSAVSIPVGGTVVFSTSRDFPFWPASDLHPSHGLYAAFDPKLPLAPSETWTFTFEQEGEWGFHDHLRSYYTGIVYVVARP